MDPKFFRRYADLITEAEQLDEGMIDAIKSKVSSITGQVKQAIPNFSQLYKEITPMIPQLKQILSSARTAEDVNNSVKQLAQQHAEKINAQSTANPNQVPANERVGDILPSTGFVAATAGVIGVGGLISETIKIIGELMTVGSLGGALQILAIPLVCVLLILWVIYTVQQHSK